MLKPNDSSCLSTSSLEKRTLSFYLGGGKKDGFCQPTEFQALSIGRLSAGHLVQPVADAVGESETALAAGCWLLFRHRDGNLLLGEAVHCFLDRPDS